MIDALPPPSHYEYVIEKKDLSSQIFAKNQALHEMAFLEGWCSKNKASILMDLIFMFKPKVIVEIGVWGGRSLIPMAMALKENNKGKIYGIDSWSTEASIQGMGGANAEWWGQVNHEKIYEGLIKHINRLKLCSQIEIIRKKSENAPEIYDIDILHIDGNHSEEASYFDVSKWLPLVSKGGIIIFDDINWQTTALAVSFLDEHCTKLAEFKGDNIWGIWLKN